jgi:hypothetical protein
MILENNSFDNKTIEKFNFYVYGLIDPYSEDIFHFNEIEDIFEHDVNGLKMYRVIEKWVDQHCKVKKDECLTYIKEN